MKENLGQSYSIVKLNTKTKEMTGVYQFILDLKQVDLLAQSAMCNKQDHELIYITAGWNISINKNHPEEYKEALKLAEEHRC